MTTRNNLKYKRIAIVTESLWYMEGANKVLDAFAELFPQADIYALFGERKHLSQNINKHKIYFSFLNKLPLIKKIYRYTFNFWPLAIESFNFSKYDLVISSSHSVAHGVITSLHTKHIAYIHTPMRYSWDTTSMYLRTLGFGFLKRTIVRFNLNFIRLWDVTASIRPDILISNSQFVNKRIQKYWKRNADFVITPPVENFEGKIINRRKNYFVSGAPFEPNKAGNVLLKYASIIGFNIKIIGEGSMKRKLERKYRNFKNIEFLGRISDEEKWKVLSNAKGYISLGIEDYGIFTVEAISCGTPVLAYKEGGSTEIVEESLNGISFDKQDKKSFSEALSKFENIKWNYEKIAKESFKNANSKEIFIKEIEKILIDNQ